LNRNTKECNLFEQPLGCSAHNSFISLSCRPDAGLCLNERVGDVWRSFSSTSSNEPTAVTSLTMIWESCRRENSTTRRPLVLLNVLLQIIGKYKARARVYREIIEECRPQQ
jgi:hypothetical protein